MTRKQAIAKIQLDWWTKELGRQLANGEKTKEAERRIRKLSLEAFA